MSASDQAHLIPVLGQELSLQRHTGRPPQTKEHFSGKLMLSPKVPTGFSGSL